MTRTNSLSSSKPSSRGPTRLSSNVEEFPNGVRFEDPVIDEIIQRFIALQKFSSVSTQNFYKTLAEQFIELFNKLKCNNLPTLQKQDYDLHDRYIRAMAAGQRVSNIFGRKILLVTQKVVGDNMRDSKLGDDIQPHLDKFLNDLSKEIINPKSAIFTHISSSILKPLSNGNPSSENGANKSNSSKSASNGRINLNDMPMKRSRSALGDVDVERKLKHKSRTRVGPQNFSEEDYPINTTRGAMAKKEEKDGKIRFAALYNDNQPESMMQLINFKNVISAQLPRMPREYIVRLVMDRKHRNLVLLKRLDSGYEKVIGGICFRPFVVQHFIEIVFCAISSSEQVKGYGTLLMNHLKEHVKHEPIHYMLTYADNGATGYFKKQGFYKYPSMPRSQWESFIKNYDGGTLMECKIFPQVNYLDIPSMLQMQRDFAYKELTKVSNQHIVYKGIDSFLKGEMMPLEKIPGLKEHGLRTDPQRPKRRKVYKPSALSDLRAQLGAIHKAIRSMKDAWPFLAPVDLHVVSDYHKFIKQPMDLHTMNKKLNRHDYKTKEMYESDMRLVISNCKTYNNKETSYYRCALSIEAKFNELYGKLCRKLF